MAVEATPKRRHRVVVWALIVLASVLLVFSITANWVQRELFNTDEVANTTDEILKDEDVQEALATYSVDQLYANVDVQGEIEKRLPSGAEALAAPVAAATQQLALNVAQRALASPRVQDLVSTAIGGAQQQLVRLLEDEGEFVSTHRRRGDARVRARCSPTSPPASGWTRRRSRRSRASCRSTRPICARA